MKASIILLGAGQLGSRHLQALGLLEEPYSIFVVDPSDQNLNITRQRFLSVKDSDKHNIYYTNDIKSVTATFINIAIIATNANVRSLLIKELLNLTNISYLILEKVLFQRIKDYAEIGSLLKSLKIKTFVNCPRRMFDFYQNLKDSIAENNILQMEVIGNSWGLGCNAIHFIDLFNYLSDDLIINWENNLDDGFIDSKRNGYKEFTGNIMGQTQKGNRLNLTCYRFGSQNTSIRISTSHRRYIISEGLGEAWEVEINGKCKYEKRMFETPYQSQLTHRVIKDLLNNKTCELTPYSLSTSMHIPLIRVLLDHYNRNNNCISDICPIT